MYEDNIEVDLTEIRCGGTDCIHLALVVWYFQTYTKYLGSLAEQEANTVIKKHWALLSFFTRISSVADTRL
jgi:hypothetical protein